jgi:hypothetical protein
VSTQSSTKVADERSYGTMMTSETYLIVDTNLMEDKYLHTIQYMNGKEEKTQKQ